MRPAGYLAVLGCALGLALVPAAAVRAQVETVAAIAAPAGWTRAEVGPLALSVPPNWRLVEDRKRTKIWFGGDMDTITGPAAGLLMDRQREDIVKPDEISSELSPLRLPGGMVFDRVRVVRDLTPNVRIDSIILRSQEADEDGYYLGVMIGGYNVDYDADAALYARILGTLRIAGADPVIAAPAVDATEMPAPAVQVETVPIEALGGWVRLELPATWVATGGADDMTLGLHAPGRAGFATLTRGSATTGPGGLLDAAPAAAAHRRVNLAGGEADLFEWAGGLATFGTPGARSAGAHRLFLLRECGPEGERLALSLAGTREFLASPEAATLTAGLRLSLPDGAGPCPELPRLAAPAPVAATASVAPARAGTTPDEGTRPAPAAPATPAVTPPAMPPDGADLAGGDSFSPQGGGYSLYVNGRYGTRISYPSDYFTALEPPGNGDGRSFVSADGRSRFHVFAQYDALGLPLEDQLERDWQLGGYDEVTYQRRGRGWYVLSGYKGGDVFYRKVIHNGPAGLLRVFEITYPRAQKGAFDLVVANMANSFGPKAEITAPPTALSPYPPAPAQVTPPPVQAATWPRVNLARVYTPDRNTAARAALMDAARVPIAQKLGQQVIFVVDILNTDGTWAYLQARPVQPDGKPINWNRTRFAREFKAGMMSDVAMILMLNKGGRWQVVDNILGPTDVFWYNWLDIYGLPEAFFLSR